MQPVALAGACARTSSVRRAGGALTRDERARLGPVNPCVRLAWVVLLSTLAAMLVALGWLVSTLVADL